VQEQPQLIFEDLGLMAYEDCLARQRQVHARVAAGAAPATVLFVEHPPVLTLGHNANPEFIKFAPKGVSVVPIERGGEVTAHEPGQQVMYPILRLADFKLMPKRYVELLEDAVIRVLAGFGVAAGTDPEHPGVWVGREKVCAIGIRVKDRASLHGIALNVCNDLALFDMIVPCGIQGRGVTTLSRLLGRPVPTAPVREALTQALRSTLQPLRSPTGAPRHEARP
jgi:lipoate-protein ligase B